MLLLKAGLRFLCPIVRRRKQFAERNDGWKRRQSRFALKAVVGECDE